MYSNNNFSHLLGKKVGFLFSYLLFSVMLFHVLAFTDKIPKNWMVGYVFIITFVIILFGKTIQGLIK